MRASQSTLFNIDPNIMIFNNSTNICILILISHSCNNFIRSQIVYIVFISQMGHLESGQLQVFRSV